MSLFTALTRLALAAVLMGASQFASAMVCKSLNGGSYLSEYIGPVSVPDTVPDGTIIWRSKTHVVPADCWKLFDIHYKEDDPIYFYGNPAGLNATPWGIEFGLVYRGVTSWDGDWSSNPTQGVNSGFISRGCPDATSGADMLACSRVTPSIAFQVVIRKRGLLPLQRPSQDTYDVFQFDGLYGLNGGPSNPAGNFRFQLSGLQNIVGTACTVDVKVTPEPGIVDFGVIQKTTTGFSPNCWFWFSGKKLVYKSGGPGKKTFIHQLVPSRRSFFFDGASPKTKHRLHKNEFPPNLTHRIYLCTIFAAFGPTASFS